jgi:hypothetical protein
MPGVHALRGVADQTTSFASHPHPSHALNRRAFRMLLWGSLAVPSKRGGLLKFTTRLEGCTGALVP